MGKPQQIHNQATARLLTDLDGKAKEDRLCRAASSTIRGLERKLMKLGGRVDHLRSQIKLHKDSLKAKEKENEMPAMR